MGILVYVLGRSGTGKSFSMRNFPKEKLAVINVQGKVLPFKGAGSIEQTATDNSDNILKALDIYAHDYKSIVVDDYQYVMSNEFMRRSYERGYDKFTEIGRHAWDIANKVKELPDDVIVYIMCHTDKDDEGNEKIKTIGKLLDEKVCLEGLSTIVLKTNVSDNQYTFLTQNNGKDTVKSPYGMFPTYAIDNDLWYVDQKIRNYYELGEFKNDEEIAEMDQAAEKAEIAKPDADGRKRRNRNNSSASNERSDSQQAESGSDGTGANSNIQTESGRSETDETVGNTAGTESQSISPSEPKTRRRKPRTEQLEEVIKDEEKPLETAENAPQNVETPEAPKRRRRKANAVTKEDIASVDLSIINNDDLPF